MKLTLKTIILFALALCMVLPTLLLCACNGDTSDGTMSPDVTVETPDGTTAGNAGNEDPENTEATTGGNAGNETPDATPVLKNTTGPIKDGARILVVGNSYVHYGRFVIGQGKTVLTQMSRENDTGYFYQLCKQKGVEVNVTNWTFGGHGISIPITIT